jgi:hypothetical protein
MSVFTVRRIRELRNLGEFGQTAVNSVVTANSDQGLYTRKTN